MHCTYAPDGVKFNTNEEDWPNADLSIRSSCEGALIDGLSADKVKAGDKRETTQMKDSQLFSRIREEDVPPRKSVPLAGWAGHDAC